MIIAILTLMLAFFGMTLLAFSEDGDGTGIEGSGGEGTDTYTVTWMNGNTVLEKDENVESGSTPSYGGDTPTKAATAQYSYEFVGWATEDGKESGVEESELPEVSGDATYYAAFSKTVNYTVTWVNDDNSVLLTERVAAGTTPTYSGTTPTKPTTPEYTYTFSGWTPEISEATENITYKATYKEIQNVASVGSGNDIQYFTVLSDAFVYSYQNNEIESNRTVIVLADITQPTYSNLSNSRISFLNSGEYILDLNGHDVTTTADQALQISESAKLTLRDSSINKTGLLKGTQYVVVKISGSSEFIFESGTIQCTASSNMAVYLTSNAKYTQNGGTLKASCRGIGVQAGSGVVITVNGGNISCPGQHSIYDIHSSSNNTTININGGTIDSGNGHAIYFTRKTNVNVSGGTLKGVNASIYGLDSTSAGSIVTITGGTFDITKLRYGELKISENGGSIPTFNGQVIIGPSAQGYGVNAAIGGGIFNNDVYARSYANVDVTGGKFGQKVYIENGKEDFSTLSVSGGKFAIDPSPYVKIGYSVKENNDEDKETYPLKVEDRKCTVTFLNSDGSVVKAAENYAYGTAGSDIAKPVDPTMAADQMYSYSFKGWNDGTVSYGKDDTLADVTEDVTYTAEYDTTPVDHTITFNSNGGSSVDSITQEYGSAITPPANPTREGYTFAGWSPEIPANMPAEDITLTAQWTAKSHNVTYNYTGTAPPGAPAVPVSSSHDYGTEVNVADSPECAGYTFSGWTTSDAIVSDSKFTMPDKDVTLSGSWTINQYTITFKDGENTLHTITQNYNSAVTPPAYPTKEGYTFQEWDAVIPSSMPAKDMTINAIWTVNSYNVSYSYSGDIPNGAPSAPASSSHEYGASVTVDTATKLAGYTFSGWTADGLSVDEGSFTMPAKDVTFTGTWTANGETKYKVEHYLENTDGLFIHDQSKDQTLQGQTDTIATANPISIDHYSYDSENSNNVASGTIAGNESLVLKLYYKLDRHNITFVDSNGTTVLKETVEYPYGTAMENIVKPADPKKNTDSRYSYEFAGWEPAVAAVTNDQTYKAKYTETPINYTLSFDTDGGSTIASITQGYGTAITVPANPTKVGYTFTGWDKAIPPTMPDNDMTVKAQWTINSHKVTYSYNGTKPDKAPAAPSEVSYDYGTAVTVEEAPTLEGYTFSGWTLTGAETSGSSFSMPDNDVSITGSWTINKYKITFDTAGGNTIADIEQYYGTDITAPADPARKGYTFDGWDKEIPSTMPAEDITITAKWKANSHKVRYMYGGNPPNGVPAVPEEKSYDYDSSVTLEQTPSFAGYDFIGWSTLNQDVSISDNAFAMPDSDVVFSGYWNPRGDTPYTVEHYFEQTDGTYVIDADKTEHKTGKTRDYVYAAEGNFDHYTCDKTIPGTRGSGNIAGDGSLVLKLYYKLDRHSITFVDSDGETVLKEAEPYPYGTAADDIEKPDDPTKETDSKYSYTFSGWTPSLADVTEDATYKATYSKTPVEHTITFVTGGGTEIAPITQGYGTTITKPADPEKVGHTFSGWDVAVPDTMPDENLTITAKWSIHKNDVSYSYTGPVPEGAAAILPATQKDVEYGANVDVAAAPAITGYTFSGWSTNDAEVADGKFTMPDNDVAFTGSWTINKYKITFDTAGGSSIAAIEQDYGTKISAPADPEREGYTFGGWDKDIPSTMPAEDMTITAKWKINSYKVSYSYGNEAPDGAADVPVETAYDYDSEVSVAAAPAVDGYTFSGWTASGVTVSDGKFNMPAKDVSFTGTWTAEGDTPYKVEHYLEQLDGTYSHKVDSDQKLTGETGTTATANQRSFEHYSYDSQNSSNKPSGTIAGNGSLVLKLYYKLDRHSISFEDSDGTVLKFAKDYPYGTAAADIEKPADPTKQTDAQYIYTFAGWTPEISNVTKDTVYRASYSTTLRKYTVTWTNYDDSVLETDENVAYGSAPEFNGTTPVKPGNAQYSYVFTGWAPAVSDVKGDATYKAQFRQDTNKYTVTWKNDNGEVLKTEKLLYGTTPVYDGADPEKAATAQYRYTFKGWTDGSDSYGKGEELPAVSGNTTYTAEYSSTVNKYTVIWTNYDGTELERDANVPYGETPKYNGEEPTRPIDADYEYTFKGWTPGVSKVVGDITYEAAYSTIRTAASIGSGEDTEYFTNITDAMKEAEDGDTITVLADNTWPAKVSVKKKLTLDLNGKTVTCSSFFTVDDEFTITDSSEAADGKLTGDTAGLIRVTKDAVLTVKGGTISSTNDVEGGGIAVDLISGRLVMEGGTISSESTKNFRYAVRLENKGSSAEVRGGRICNGEGSAIYIRKQDAEDAHVLITGGEIESAINTILVGEGAYGSRIEIKGGTVRATTGGAIANSSRVSSVDERTKIIITGGSVIAGNQIIADIGNADIAISGDPEMVTPGGKFGWLIMTLYGTLDISGGEFTGRLDFRGGGDQEKAVISGGNFNSYEDDTLNNGEKLSVSGGYFTRLDESDLADKCVRIESDKEGYNYKVAKLFDVTFKNGNSVLKTVETIEGKPPAYDGDTPEKEKTAQYSYTFKGWTDGNSSYGKDEELPAASGNTTYAAEYSSTVNKYNVSFEPNGGSGEMEEQLVEYGNYELPDNGFDAPANKVFEGWKAGSKTYKAGDTIEIHGETVVYAQWVDGPELSEAKKKALSELDGIDSAIYSEPEKTKVTSIIDAARKAISAANDEAEVVSLLNNAKADIGGLNTAAQKAEEQSYETVTEEKVVYNAKLPKIKAKKALRYKKSVTARWKKLSKAKRKKITGIEIRIATNKKFTKNVKVVYAKRSAASKKIKKLARKKTYYIKVRTYKKADGVKYVGKWSKTIKVRTR